MSKTNEETLAKIDALNRRIDEVTPFYLLARRELSEWNLKLAKLLNEKHELQRQVVPVTVCKPGPEPGQRKRTKKSCILNAEETAKLISGLSQDKRDLLLAMLKKN